MPSTNPTISNHAIQRAFERLGIKASTFIDWVQNTHIDWMPVNAQFLINHNVKVDAHDSWFYICPWNSWKAVAFVLSEDNCIRTIIDFDMNSKIALEHAEPAKPIECVVNLSNLKIETDNILHKTIVKIISLGEGESNSVYQKILRIPKNLNQEDMEYCESFIKNEITIKQLREILGTKDKYKETVWHQALEANRNL